MDEYELRNRDRNCEAQRSRMRVSGRALKLTIIRAPKLSAEQKKRIGRGR